ncbi:MAG: hypothetical protein QW763_01350 [Archaeoglobaceae archaeon]
MRNQVRLGTYISREAFRLLAELSKEYGSQSKVIEESLKLLYELRRQNMDLDVLFLRENFMENFDCVIITKNNLGNLIKGDFEKFYSEQFIDAMVKFIAKNEIEKISIEEIFTILFQIYVKGARWFTNIEFRRDIKEDYKFEITFTHTLDEDYSRFFCNYFESFFTRNNYEVERKRISSKFFSITIKKLT